MRRFEQFLASCIATAAMASAPVAAQVVIDFDGLSLGEVVTNQFPEATFSSDPGFLVRTDSTFDLGTSLPLYICTAEANGDLTCVNNIYVDFTYPVENLTFLASGDNDAGVTAQVNVFVNGGMAGTVDVVTDAIFEQPNPVDLSGFNNVTRIEIVNVTDGGGLAFDDFTFDQVAECFLFVGDGAARLEPFEQAGHVFWTQLTGVFQVHEVLLSDFAYIPLSTLVDDCGVMDFTSPVGGCVGQFRTLRTAQVHMWNPVVFPDHPAQWSQALALFIYPDQRIVTVPYGDSDGMQLYMQTYPMPDGDLLIAFPFTIDGF